jgi:hypothetical protein
MIVLTFTMFAQLGTSVKLQVGNIRDHAVSLCGTGLMVERNKTMPFPWFRHQIMDLSWLGAHSLMALAVLTFGS